MLKKLTLLIGLIASISTFSQINSGSPNIPFGSNTSYDFGLLPNNLPSNGTYGASTEAASAWETFKNGFVENCGSGRTRVKFDNQSETVSEGIAYTMLLAAYAADQDVFDGLWAYYKINRNGNGVMNWKINGCNNGTIGQNGATDAELDAAMALIIADKQWGSSGQTHNYDTDAIALINAIKLHEVSNNTFNNGDGWGDASGCRNPSYQSPAYARVYSLFLQEKGVSNSGWTTIANSTATLLKNNSGQTNSGLPSNWSLENGAPNNSCSASGTTPSSFGYDATRAPWRQGTDYLWFGSESNGMQTIVNTQTDFWINRGGASQVKGGNNFSQAGNGNGDHNGAFIGMVGAQALASSNTTAHQSFVNDMYIENRNVDFNGYFPRVLRCLGLFVQTGNFWNPYSETITSGQSNPVVTITAPSDNFQTCLGVDYTINANASDTDGSVTKVEFYDGNTLLGTDNSAPFTYNVTGNTAGVKTYKTKAFDNDGLTSFSPSITVTVTTIQSTDGITCGGSISEDFNAVIDDFDSEDEVSLGATGDYGIYWWTPVGSSIYEINRTENNMTLTLNGADPKYEVFGVGFGMGKSINLEDFSNADIRLNLTNNSNTDIRLTIQIKDVNGNAAEIQIEEATGITWANQWKKLGLDIPRGQTIDEIVNLSAIPNQLGGFSAVSWGCATAIACPEVSYDLDPTQISEIIFIVNGGAGVDNTLLPATGELVFNYFSIGETENTNSNIIEKDATPPFEDADGDLVEDGLDLCANTPIGQSVNADGCSSSQLDSDGDNVNDDVDQCPNTPTGTTVDATGCTVVIIITPEDTDGDNVVNANDLCPNTPAGQSVNSDGCAESQLDDDGDGVNNDKDKCPDTPINNDVDAEGCLAEGLQDASSFGIEIFPIPATETLNIVQTRSNMNKATLLNISGRIVLETILESDSETISIQGIESGIYILQLDGTEGSTQKQLIIE